MKDPTNFIRAQCLYQIATYSGRRGADLGIANTVAVDKNLVTIRFIRLIRIENSHLTL